MIKSFKFNKRIFKIEFLFLAVLLLSTLGWMNLMEYRQNVLFDAHPSAVTAQSDEEVKSLIGDFQIFMTFLIVSTLALILINLYMWCLTRAMLWRSKRVLRTIYLKLVWTVMWIPFYFIFTLPIFIIASGVRDNPDLIFTYTIIVYANVLLYLLISYFGYFMYTQFYRTDKIVDSIFYGLRAGMKHLRKFIFPIFGTVMIFTVSLYVISFLQFNLITKFLAFLFTVYVLHAIEKYFINRAKVL